MNEEQPTSEWRVNPEYSVIKSHHSPDRFVPVMYDEIPEVELP